MVVSYNRNAGLALDAGLAMMLRCRTHRLASVLKRGGHRLALKLNVKLLRLAFVLKRGATQARVLMVKRDREVCVSNNNKTITCGRDYEVRSEIGMRPMCLTKDARSAFGLKRDPRVWHEACV